MNPNIRELVKLFERARYQYDVYQVFSDAVEAMALSISNAVDRPQYDKREKRYMEIVGRYDKATVDTFPRIMAEVALGLEAETTDVLGQTFHELELHNKDRGQYFTPMHLCQLMARMTVGDNPMELVEAKGYITASEPACGSGAMIIALAEALESKGVNYQQQLHVTAIDIDARAAHMAYVQFSLLNIPAAVYVGNTLSMEMREVFYTPAHILDGWGYRLRSREAVNDALALEQPQEAAASVEPDIRVEQPEREQLALFDSPSKGIGL